MPEQRHFTTRRGFVAALGFGAVSLYGVWVAVGAAPLPFGGGGRTAEPAADGRGGHEAHGGHAAPAPAPAETGEHGAHGASSGMTPEEFRLRHARFIETYAQRDGGVSPHADHDGHSHGAAGEPVDVYLMARRFAYSPDVLRLRAGRAYRLRMMADDVAHGASIQMGAAGRIIRLRPNVVAEQTVTFSRPGEHLVYCTVYCGQAHDAMYARIFVA